MTQPQPGWLDDEPAESVAPTKRRKRTRKAKKARKSKESRIVAANGIPREAARRFGPGRIWGCDGNFVFFRPKRMVDGEWKQVANPEAMERHQRFINQGHYEYIETSDDVQIFRVTERSPFKRGFGSIQEMKTEDVKRAVIMAAVKREWTLYVDALEELAVRIKSRRFTDGKFGGALAADQWSEMLAYIDLQIMQRRGPTPEECGSNLQRIRMLRNGGGTEKRILIL